MKKFLAAFLSVIVLGAVVFFLWVRLSTPQLRLGDTVELLPSTKAAQHSVTLLVVGDTGSAAPGQFAVAKLLEDLCVAQHPQGVLLLGDNFYMSGVRSVDDSQWNEKFEDMYRGPCLKTQKFYAIFGNHDYMGSKDAQIIYSQKNPRWVMPARTYQIKAGPALDLFVMDTNVPDWCGLTWCSLDALGEQMKKSTAAWKILLGHHPVLTAGKYKGRAGFSQWVTEKFICHNQIPFYFSGHDHNLQHLHQQKGASGASCEYDQVIVGAGGASLYPVAPLEGVSEFAEASYGAMVLRVDDQRLHFAFYGADKGFNHPLYSASTRRQKNETTPQERQ